MRGKSETFDEDRHFEYGEKILKAGTFHRESKLYNSKMPVSVLNALPAYLAERAGHPLVPRSRLFLCRIPTVILGMILGALVFAWACEAFGIGGGIVALFLYTFSPNILAHSRLITTDIPVTLGIFASVYTLWRYVCVPSRKRLVVAGVAFGLAQLTKVTAHYLVFLAPLLLSLDALRAGFEEIGRGGDAIGGWRAKGRRLLHRQKRVLGITLILWLFGLFFLNLGFGFEGTFTPLSGYEKLWSPAFRRLAALPLLKDLPLPLPYAFVEGIDMLADHIVKGRWAFLLGEHRTWGFPHYFLVAFLVKVPSAMLVLLGISVWLFATGRVRAGNAEIFWIVPILFFFVYFSFFFHNHIGLRYILPIFPFLFLFVSRVVSYRPLPTPFGAVVSVLLLAYGAGSAAIHPHYLAFFNQLAGGPEKGWKILIDSNLDWDQDREAIDAYIEKVRPIPVYKVDRRRGMRPRSGRIAIQVNTLQGIQGRRGERFYWLKNNFEPIDFVGYTWLIYDVPPLEMLRRIPFSVRWEGQLEIDTPGRYTFLVEADDRVRISLDGKRIIDRWSKPRRKGERLSDPIVATQRLGRGRHTLVIDYRNLAKEGKIRLRWRPPDGRTTPIPPERLFYPYRGRDGKIYFRRGGLRAIYAEGKAFEHPRFVHIDARIDFDWGSAPPVWVAADPLLQRDDVTPLLGEEFSR